MNDFQLEEGESYRYCDFCKRQGLGHHVTRDGSKSWSCYYCIAENIKNRGIKGERFSESQLKKGLKLDNWGESFK